MSFPMIADRECYFYGEGFDRFDVDGTLVVISKSVHDVNNIPLLIIYNCFPFLK